MGFSFADAGCGIATVPDEGKRMPPKKTKSARRSSRRAAPPRSDVRSVSDQRLEKLLGRLHKSAEAAAASTELSDKTRKTLQTVCRLAKEAKDAQPTPLPRASVRKKTAAGRRPAG